MVCRQTVNIMQAGADFNDTTELSTYGFLYGTFPAAPGAFVIATQYNIEVELVGYLQVVEEAHLKEFTFYILDCQKYGFMYFHIGSFNVYLS